MKRYLHDDIMLIIEWLLSKHASLIFQWLMIAVFVTPMALAGVSVVNRVSSMSDDDIFERGRSILHRTVTSASPRAIALNYAQAHTCITSTPLTRASTVIYNSTANNRKLTKHYIKVSTRTVTRARLLQNR